MKKLFQLLFCLSLTSIVISCKDSKIPEEFDYGKIEGHVYKNSFFGFEMDFPESWKVQSREQIEKLTQSSKDLFSENKELERAIKASEVNSAYLFAIFKDEVGAPVDFNPSMMVVAENTKNAPGIKEGKDYLFHSKKLLEQTGIPYKINDDVERKNIGGKNFDIMTVTLEQGDLKITQEYYSTVLNGFSLSFIISFADDTQKQVLHSVINNLKFTE